MTPTPTLPSPAPAPCRVLVVDDDRRVRELLEITLTTHGFVVLTAADGEEALMRARRERPDLVLLDVRLPKRSGLEVCDVLRNDPTDPAVPIILITAAAEIEQRLQGFLRGADDVMGKPFSPKELVARMRRLISRASETRASVRRALELERELQSAKREVRRADEEARREEALLAAASGPGRELLGVLDEDELTARLLAFVQLRLKARSVAVLRNDAPLPLVAHAVRGERFERVAALTLPGDGELASLLRGLARPVRRTELERIDAVRRELTPLVSGRWDLLVPFVAGGELEGIVVVEEPRIEGDDARRAWDELAVVGGFAGLALRNARKVRAQARWLLAAMSERVYRGSDAAAQLVEARRLLDRCGRALALTPSERERARHAQALFEWAGTGEGRRELDALCDIEASGLARGARTLIRAVAGELGPDADRVVVLLAAVEAYRTARARGLDVVQALERASEKAAADPFVAEALAAFARDPVDHERDAA